MTKQRDSKRRRYLRAAAKATTAHRDIASSKSTAERRRRFKDGQLGKFGAASEVRVLMKDGQPVEGDQT